MSFLDKINPFLKLSPDEMLDQWLITIENRRDKAHMNWKKKSSAMFYWARDWATPQEIEKLELILDAGAQIDRTTVPRKARYYYGQHFFENSRPLLDAVLSVSGRGAEILMARGATPTSDTFSTLTHIAWSFREAGSSGRGVNASFDFQDAAIAMVKKGDTFNHWYQERGKMSTMSGQRNTRTTALTEVFYACRQANKFDFKAFLDGEQVARGLQPGHPPLKDWFAVHGQIHQRSVDLCLRETIAGEVDRVENESFHRIDELLAIGADPSATYQISRSQEPIDLVGLAILEHKNHYAEKLLNAGAKVNWDACNTMIAKALSYTIKPGADDSVSFERARWKIFELLKVVCKFEMPDWNRPFTFHPPSGVSFSAAQVASWPTTLGEMVDYCGGGLRAELEGIYMTHHVDPIHSQGPGPSAGRRL